MEVAGGEKSMKQIYEQTYEKKYKQIYKKNLWKMYEEKKIYEKNIVNLRQNPEKIYEKIYKMISEKSKFWRNSLNKSLKIKDNFFVEKISKKSVKNSMKKLCKKISGKSLSVLERKKLTSLSKITKLKTDWFTFVREMNGQIYLWCRTNKFL